MSFDLVMVLNCNARCRRIGTVSCIFYVLAGFCVRTSFQIKYLETLSLFVFLKSDLKQNARSLLTPVSDPAFHALSHGGIGFALHGSFHFLIGQNSSNSQSEYLK